MTTAIRIENVSKLYRLGTVGTGTISHDLNRWWHRIRGKEDPYAKIGQVNDRQQRQLAVTSSDGTVNAKVPQTPEYVWALRDINFEVKQGEVLGIIGRNGAGKSTLLKLLSRVTAPTSGSIKTKGRIASLLEVGTGFHPDLTGRENIYLNGAILGMTRQDISRQLDAIVDFSGCAKYLDTPVKRYSSGMMVRLGFAVAAHLQCEILIVDEVLAVGDSEFQRKCLAKMKDVAQGGRTVLFVSHNMVAVENLCGTAALISNGTMALISNTRETIQRYFASVTTSIAVPLRSRVDRQGSGALRITHFAARIVDGRTEPVRSGSDVVLAVRVDARDLLPITIQMSIAIYTTDEQCVAVLGNMLTGTTIVMQSQTAIIECVLSRLRLTPGTYRVNLYCEANNILADWVVNAAELVVEPADFFNSGSLPPSSHGGVLFDQQWGVESSPETQSEHRTVCFHDDSITPADCL